MRSILYKYYYIIIIVLFITLFFLWIFYGGKDHEFVGITCSVKHPERCKNKCSINEPSDACTVDEYHDYITESVIKDERSISTYDESVIEVAKNRSSESVIEVARSRLVDSESVCVIMEEILPPRKKIKRSRGETECVRVLEKLFNRRFDRVRPSFLKSPLTGRNLELDCYNEELKLAIEYNGRQHYKHPSFPNFSVEDFKSQLQRDQWKRDRCNELGIYLLTVPYHIKICDIEEYIIRLLPHTLRHLI